MDDNFNRLLVEFERIKQKGWIKSNSKSSGAIGVTFEKELGLVENHSFYPDFNNIEIKCVSKKTMYPLTLFSLCFDGPGTRELNRIVDLYGYPDKVFKNKNVLSAYLSCKQSKLVNNKYFKLEIDRNNKKIYLAIYEKNNILLDKISYINFATIQNRLTTKISNLAFIYGESRFESGTFYFKYSDILLYTLKDFNTFLDLLENDDISTSIGYRINKGSLHYGKPSSKNIVFTIPYSNINKLFSKIR